MPHVILKFYPGRSAAEKRDMAERIAQALHDGMGYDVEKVSVAVEEIEPSRWMADVYEPDIAARLDQVVKRPGYGPLADASRRREAAAGDLETRPATTDGRP